MMKIVITKIKVNRVGNKVDKGKLLKIKKKELNLFMSIDIDPFYFYSKYN